MGHLGVRPYCFAEHSAGKFNANFPPRMALNRICCFLRVFSLLILKMVLFFFYTQRSFCAFCWHTCWLFSFYYFLILSLVAFVIVEKFGDGTVSGFRKVVGARNQISGMSHPCLLKCQQAKHLTLLSSRSVLAFPA